MTTCLRWLDVGIRAVQEFFHHKIRACGEVRPEVKLVGSAVNGAADFKACSIGENRGKQQPPAGVVQGAFALCLRVGAFSTEALHLAMCSSGCPRAAKSVKNPLASLPT